MEFGAVKRHSMQIAAQSTKLVRRPFVEIRQSGKSSAAA